VIPFVSVSLRHLDALALIRYMSLVVPPRSIARQTRSGGRNRSANHARAGLI